MILWRTNFEPDMPCILFLQPFSSSLLFPSLGRFWAPFWILACIIPGFCPTPCSCNQQQKTVIITRNPWHFTFLVHGSEESPFRVFHVTPPFLTASITEHIFSTLLSLSKTPYVFPLKCHYFAFPAYGCPLAFPISKRNWHSYGFCHRCD